MSESPSSPPQQPPEPESSWDKRRAQIGFVLAPLLFTVVCVVGEGGAQTRLAALFAAVAVLWITEAVPTAVTALGAVVAAVVLGVASSRDAFAAFGNPILFLFMGSFLIAEAMSVHGLGARIARALTSRARSLFGVMVAMSSTAFLLSMWTSNAAATAVILPLALAATKPSSPGPPSAPHAERRRAGAVVLAVAWGASMGGLATPVGTPPNLIGIRALADTADRIDFFGWMKLGLPLGIVMHAAMLLVLWALFLRATPTSSSAAASSASSSSASSSSAPSSSAPSSSASSSSASSASSSSLHAAGAQRPWTRNEAISCAVFAAVVVLWIVPGVLDAAGSTLAKPWHEHVPDEVVALGGAVVLFVLRALTWKDAQRIDWGTMLLFGGGVLLGDLANKTGLAASWGRVLVDVTGASTTFTIVALIAGASLVLSELASNTASATLMVPVAMALATSTHTPTAPAVLAAAIGSSFGFMMPISTAPNAMAYATGKVSIREMLVAGIVFDVVGYIVVVAALCLLG